MNFYSRLKNFSENQIIWFILAITTIIYLPTFFFGFANYDDNIYLTSNEFVKNLSLSNVQYILLNQFYGHYFPVTLLIYAVEYFFVGETAGFYHFTSVAFHLLNIALLFYVLKKLNINLWQSTLVTLVFAIHPLQVEAIAWIGGRNNLVFTFFLLAALHYYLDFKKIGKLKFYFISFLLFVFACLAKSSAVVFPVMLIVLDALWYKHKFWISLLNKIPFLIISVVFGLIAVKAAQHFGSIEPVENLYSIYNRSFVIFHQLAFYVYKLVLPVSLNILYANPVEVNGALPWFIYLGTFTVMGCFALVWFSPNQKQSLLGLMWFLINIGLTLKITVSTNVFAADRYAYFSSVWLILACSPYLNYWVKSVKFNQIIFGILGGFILFFIVQSERRIWVWQNGKSLFSAMVDHPSNLSKSLLFRGLNYIKAGDLNLAKTDLKSAVELDSNSAKNLNAYATVLMLTNQPDSSEMFYHKAISVDSTYEAPYFHLGNLYGSKQNYTLAKSYFNKYLQLDENSNKALFRLANIDIIEKNYRDALTKLNQILQNDAYFFDAYLNRGFVHLQLDNKAQACADWVKAKQGGVTEANNLLAKYCLN